MDLNRLKTYAPIIAIALILVTFAVARFVVRPLRANAPEATPAPQAAPAPKATASAPTPTPAPTATPAAPAASASATPLPEVPVATTWPTYHGGPDLCGYADIAFPDTLTRVWQHIAEGPVRQPIVGDDTALYGATSNGSVFSLTPEGQPRWSRKLTRPAKDGAPESPERFNAPIAVFQGRVLAGAQSGMLYALDAATGEPAWTFDVHGEILGAPSFFAPADPAKPPVLFQIERGEGVFHALDFTKGTELWKTDPIARCDGHASAANGIAVYGSCASALHAYDANAGRILNNIPLCDDCQVASGIALAGDEAYAGNRSGQIVRANLRTGQILWKFTESDKEVFTTPALSKDLLIYGDEGDLLRALDRQTGQKKWEIDTGTVPSSAVIAKDKVFYTAGGALHTLALDTGKQIATLEVADTLTQPSIAHNLLLVASDDGTISAYH